MLSLKIGWRNLKRRKLRSILTGLMFFVGTYLLVFFVGLAEGTYEGMLTIGTRIWSGDFQIVNSDYNDKPALYKTLEYPASDLDFGEEVEAHSGRLESFGLLAYQNRTIGAFLNGIEPDKEKQVCGFVSTLVEGSWWKHSFNPDDSEGVPAVLGKDVLKRLNAKMGDTVSFVSQASDGSIAAELLTVTGVLETGIGDLDRQAVFIPLQSAQSILALEGQVHRLVGIVTDRSSIPQLTGDLQKQLLSKKSEGRVLPWYILMPELDQTIKADREGLYLFLIIILIVVLLGVANTMMMSVMERQHELGLLQALGTTPLQLIRIILSEIFWLGIIGIGFGIFSGIMTMVLLGDNGFPMGGYSFSYGGVIVDKMVPIVTFNAVVIFPALILLCGLISGLLPAIRASRLRPAHALGRTL